MAKKSVPTTSESNLFAFQSSLPMNELVVLMNYGVDYETEVYVSLFSDKSVHMTVKNHFTDDEHHWGIDNFFELPDGAIDDSIDTITTKYHRQVFKFLTYYSKSEKGKVTAWSTDKIVGGADRMYENAQLNKVDVYTTQSRHICFEMGEIMAEKKFSIILDDDKTPGLSKVVIASSKWLPRSDSVKVCLHDEEEDFYFESDDSLDVQCEGQMVACVESSPNKEDKDFSGSPGNYEIYKIVFTEYGNFACQKVKMKASRDDSAGEVIKSQARLFKEEEGQLLQEFFGFNRLAKKLYKQADFTNIAPVITDGVINKSAPKPSYTNEQRDAYNEFGKVADMGASMN